MPRTEAGIAALFTRYAAFVAKALDGEADIEAAASFYAGAFIAATPAGIVAGENDDRWRQALAGGFERYRDIGTKAMTVRTLRVSAIDDCHSIAHVGWSAVYARAGQADVTIDFDVHYLVQTLDGEPKIFGWISGDEQDVLRRHGIL